MYNNKLCLYVHTYVPVLGHYLHACSCIHKITLLQFKLCIPVLGHSKHCPGKANDTPDNS